MTDHQIDTLVTDVQRFATEWADSVRHYRDMTDRAFRQQPYTANELANDMATLNANFLRDAARLVNASTRALTLAAQRANNAAPPGP